MMAAVMALYSETRRWRLHHKARGKEGQIEAAACVIRERALIDAMRTMGLSSERIRELEKCR